MTEEVKKAHEILEESGVEPVMIDPVETTEVDVDPLITTKVAYVERIKSELGGIKEQMGVLQYELDIRVTALALYESSLQMQDDPKENGKDESDS